MPRLILRSFLLGLFGLMACSPPVPTPSAPADCSVPSPPRVRRLSAGEYEAALRDLVGELPFVASFPQDPLANGFDNDADALIVSPAHLDEYARVAEQVAAKVSPLALAPCPPDEPAESCGRAFVT